MNQAEKERIKLLEKTIKEIRATHPSESEQNCWGSLGILRFLQSGDVDDIGIRDLRERIRTKLGGT